MNLIFLSYIFLFIKPSYAKCISYDFKLPLRANVCGCEDLIHSPRGRIFNGTDLDPNDAQYVTALYALNDSWLGKFFTIFCSGVLINPRFVLT